MPSSRTATLGEWAADMWPSWTQMSSFCPLITRQRHPAFPLPSPPHPPGCHPCQRERGAQGRRRRIPLLHLFLLHRMANRRAVFPARHTEVHPAHGALRAEREAQEPHQVHHHAQISGPPARMGIHNLQKLMLGRRRSMMMPPTPLWPRCTTTAVQCPRGRQQQPYEDRLHGSDLFEAPPIIHRQELSMAALQDAVSDTDETGNMEDCDRVATDRRVALLRASFPLTK
ncbi:unnamed protein product [Vitrella brassicaformis CCMP3155]|uniref:Uncharacterized protein n=1 Tax=Vitrella brassicaformis (strain CCMP3155) TaxID=1169540 RepID=A0A0G4E9S7_VITBC|nr:unnamed protein product [Vitrella brassicaformis CCMP3155]|eukprot:CEL91937.1 unnamed protein product [Vitrella brassicaformis CCMP3155]